MSLKEKDNSSYSENRNVNPVLGSREFPIDLVSDDDSLSDLDNSMLLSTTNEVYFSNDLTICSDDTDVEEENSCDENEYEHNSVKCEVTFDPSFDNKSNIVKIDDTFDDASSFQKMNDTCHKELSDSDTITE